MRKEIVARLDLRPGALYVYAPWSKKKVDGEDVSGQWPQGTYEIIGLGKCVPVFQELIAYRGVDGTDAGELFFCTPWDFATKFVKVETEKKVDELVAAVPFVPLPEKVADNRSHGKF